MVETALSRPITDVVVALLVLAKVSELATWSYIAHHPDPMAEQACRPCFGKIFAVPSWRRCIRNHYHYPSWSEFSAGLWD